MERPFASPSPGSRRWPALLLAGVLAAVAVAGPVAGQARSPQPRFTLGDDRARVREVQGQPDVVERLASLGVEVWEYGGSTVKFSAATGRVVEWTDAGRRLQVELRPVVAEGPVSTIALGDSRDDVVRRLGTPWAYTRDEARHADYLAYGRSVIRVDHDGGRVTGWIRRDNAVDVSAADDEAARAAMGAMDEPPPPAPDRRAGAAPPALRASARWRDDDGDGVVSPGEGVTITLAVRNEGRGPATGVTPAAQLETPDDGLRLSLPDVHLTIAAGDSARVTVRLASDHRLTVPAVSLVIWAREGNGFDLAPRIRLRIPTRPAGQPRVVVRSLRVDDASGDGRIAPREITDLTVRLANEGTGPTPPLSGRIVLGRDVFLAGGAPAAFSLGALPPGGTADVTLSLYTNTRAADRRVSLELDDPRGVPVARLPLDLAFDAPLASVVEAPGGGAPGSPPPSRPLVDDIERGLPHALEQNPDAIAVLIGIERYRALPDARFAARDAALMRRYAVDVLGVPNDAEHLYVRADAEATGGELRKVFGEQGWLARRTDENTDLVVYFAGHGAPAGEGADATPFLLPFDADANYVRDTGYELAELYDRLARLPARSITVILDACFTGLTRDRRPLVSGTRPSVISIEHPALLRRNMAVLAAARGAETAGDLPGERHGLFTWFVARGLRGEADADGDGAITVAELGHFVEQGVSRAALRLEREQRPLTIARDSLHVIARIAPR